VEYHLKWLTSITRNRPSVDRSYSPPTIMTDEKRIAAEHKLPCKLRLTPDSAADLCFRLRHGSSRDAKESFPNGVAFSPVSGRTYGSLYAEITVPVLYEVHNRNSNLARQITPLGRWSLVLSRVFLFCLHADPQVIAIRF
jgi:hypothetical protein